MKLRTLLGLLVLFALPAYAQNTITFTAQTTTGNGSVVPVLTWSTSPAATGCTASGDAAWSGTKAAAGTQTLAAITQSATYNLTCNWQADTQAVVSWTLPTQNEGGSAYADPKAVVVRWAFGADPRVTPLVSGHTLTEVIAGATARQLGPTITTTTITGLTQIGTYNFTAYACNLNDACSMAAVGVGGTLVSKAFTGAASQNRTVGITVNPVPQPISGVSVL